MTHVVPEPRPNALALDMRQLRHQTKNALTQIMARVSASMPATAATRRVLAQVEDCVMLTAQISDALFGLTKIPAPLPDRLLALCEAIVALSADRDQMLTLNCRVIGCLPETQHETVLRIAHEFVGNAIKHGMHLRLVGRIDVAVLRYDSGALLRVEDDGWGYLDLREGEGLGVARALASDAGGTISVQRSGERTLAQLFLPTPQ